MTRFSSDSTGPTPQTSHADTDSLEEPLGWEGHVNVPGSPAWTNLLGNWPELRTGLAFSMVFIVGAVVGGTVALLVGCNRTKS